MRKLLRQGLPTLPGTKLKIAGADDDSDASRLTVNVFGDPGPRLTELAEEVRRRVALLPGVDGVERASDRGSKEIEVFVQRERAARYGLTVGGATERQSSSGLIVTTGTGATGWAKSINQGRLELPQPAAPELAWFVREAWESPATGASLTAGVLAPGAEVTVTSEIDAVVFGDGIEDDRLEVDWGQRVTIGAAEQRLRLVAT